MASHLHEQISDAVVAKLTGLATSGARVYVDNLMPLPDALSPTLLITLDDEKASPETIHAPVLLDRDLDMVVSAVAKATSGLRTTLNQMSKEVEAALAAGITVGSATIYPIYTGMSRDDEQGDKPVGVKRMTFSITYTAMSNAPDVLT
jgi:hypothetical protein